MATEFLKSVLHEQFSSAQEIYNGMVKNKVPNQTPCCAWYSKIDGSYVFCWPGSMNGKLVVFIRNKSNEYAYEVKEVKEVNEAVADCGLIRG